MQDKTKTEGTPDAENSDQGDRKIKRAVRVTYPDTNMPFSQQIVVERIKNAFPDIPCRVRFAEGKTAKISETDEAYFEILRHWDRRELYYDKGFRILVMSKDDNLYFEIILNSRRKTVTRDKFLIAFQNIHDIQPSCKVFLGQNNPKRPVLPTEKETSFARYIKKIGEKLRIKVVDQMILSGTECFSFEENEYMHDAVVPLHK